MFNLNDKVVRKNNPEKNKKWPEQFLNTPLRITWIDGNRLYFEEVPDLFNPKGWVSERFISVFDPAYRRLQRFL